MIALQELIEEDECLYGFHVDSKENWRTRDLTWTLVCHDDDRLIAFIHCLPMSSQGAICPTEARINKALIIENNEGVPVAVVGSGGQAYEDTLSCRRHQGKQTPFLIPLRE